MTENDARDSSRGNEGNKLAYLLIGGAIGVILGLLFAPKSGQELRSDIADAMRKGIDRSREDDSISYAGAGGGYSERARDRARRRDEAVGATSGGLPGDEGFPEP